MFTGIITDVGEVVAAEGAQGTLRRLRINASYDPASIALGASIACGGPCLTVVAVGARDGGCWFDVDAASETLERTTVPQWEVGTRINLERSLKIGDELGGHIVTGHVDGVATIVAREAITASDDPWGPTARFYIKAPAALAPFIAEKGSVCLDGTSLTVNSVKEDVFSVLIIPYTLAVTTWGERQVDDALNIEVDLMARYAARLADARRGE
ncbi:riboflavin synthase [Microvirga puerhi]|uniref:Riboflavin synthase n=1 Tax=Microvirga puerhi TaxID=2876078 RepID=A0ABS7VHL5_9HYPH|nr:riboflavin synthase [Microvirga puerhi]MBZ6074999.1 riboflavin synthase [Microvirga puerhi]